MLTRRNLLGLAPSSLALSACQTFGMSPGAESSRGVRFGMAATEGPLNFYEDASELGLTDHAVAFWKLGDDEPLPVERHEYRQETGLIVVVEFPRPEEEISLLQALRNGYYDPEIMNLARRIAGAGRPVTIRGMHEGNGDWFAHCAYFRMKDEHGRPILGHPRNNIPADFKPAFQHFVEVLRETLGDYSHLVTIDLNYNRTSARGNGVSDFDELYPGDKYVDIISVSTYNRCGIARDRTENRPFAADFRPAYDAITAMTSRPIAIAETGTAALTDELRSHAGPVADACQDQIAWHRETLIALRDQFPRVVEVSYFLAFKDTGTASNDWPFTWAIQDPGAFADLIRRYPDIPNL